MKKILYLVSVIFLVTVVIGCGKNITDKNEKKEEVKIKDTVTYKSINGDVKIPIEPKAIVADYYVGELLKLEANLVGADLTYKSSAWADKVKNITDIGQSMETISSLSPDLIITFKADLVEQYSAIAPTICIPYGTYNPEELLKELSIITNRKDIAEQWCNEFNKKIEQLDSYIKNKDKTVTIVDILANDLYLYGENYGRAGYILYNKLGLKGTADGEKDYIHKDESYLLLTVEAMSKYVGDYLFMLSADGTKKSNSDVMDTFINSPVWEELEAVKNNNIIYLKSEDFWYTDPFSLDLQLEILMRFYNEKK